MDDEAKKGPGKPGSAEDAEEIDIPLEGSLTDWRSSLPALYSLEQPVLCGHCRQEIDRLYVVRLYRSKVNFVSSLPRSGRVLICPHCRTIVPGELGGVL
ncbi:MAG TPA: hypothetical protein VFE33_00615 [Thermoanaerobaculia bacterium]|nr:hypothetical protein [Thermoanaerobaculia bacterium]